MFKSLLQSSSLCLSKVHQHAAFSSAVTARLSSQPTGSSAQALALIKSQPSHYVIGQLHQRLYLLAENDILTVPRIDDLKVGEKIKLSRIIEVGSRDYTLRAAPRQKIKGSDYQPERPTLRDDQVQVWATVIEHTKSKIQHIEKFKRRHRYHRLLHHKGKWTRLRINEIVISPGATSSTSATSTSFAQDSLSQQDAL